MRFLYYTVFVLLLVFAHQAEAGKHTNPELYFKTTLKGDFHEITDRVKAMLAEQGFSVITEIDMDKKLNEKLDVDVRPYRILGVCNPGYAYETLQIDDNIGVFLPCKIIIKQLDDNQVEVVSVNPSQLMRMMGDEALSQVADQVTVKLKHVIDQLD